jgi:hypothetical protein
VSSLAGEWWLAHHSPYARHASRKSRSEKPAAPHFELRVDDLRVFYRVDDGQVNVVLIGKKQGSHLVIGGKRFTL